MLRIEEFQRCSNGIALSCHWWPTICDTELMVADVNEVPEASAQIVIPVSVQSFEYGSMKLDFGSYANRRANATRVEEI